MNAMNRNRSVTRKREY